MAIEPVTHLERYIAGTVEPVTHLEKVISEYGGGGGGGSITVDAELNANSTNPVQNRTIVLLAAQLLEELASKADEETTVTVTGTTPTITPATNTIYNCGEVESLTISNPPADGAYSIVFTSGATPTDLSVDPAIKMPDGFSVEANRIYEINVLVNRAVVGSWAVSV